MGSYKGIKLYTMSNKFGNQSHGKILVPFWYLLAGAGMLLLPQFTQVVSNTLFGSGNIMAYLPKQSLSGAVLQSMTIILKAVGILWFIRGCVLLAHAGSPGDIKDCSKKGLLFLIAGILAINIDDTGKILGSFMSKLTHLFSGGTPSG